MLGSILIDPETFNLIAGILKSDDFYLDEHMQIFLAMQDLYLQNRSIDVVTLIDTLIHRGVYDENSARSYIKLIAEVVPSHNNAGDWAKIVKDNSLLRHLISACDEINEQAYSGDDDIMHILVSAEQKIFAIAEGNEQKGFTHIRELLVSTYEHLHSLQTNREEMMGTPTGFGDLDHVLVGMGKSDLILIGARPGVGKTSFALNIATNVARLQKSRLCVFARNVGAAAGLAYAVERSARRQPQHPLGRAFGRRLDETRARVGESVRMRHLHRRHDRHHRDRHESEATPRQESGAGRNRLSTADAERPAD